MRVSELEKIWMDISPREDTPTPSVFRFYGRSILPYSSEMFAETKYRTIYFRFIYDGILLNLTSGENTRQSDRLHHHLEKTFREL